MYTWTEEQTQIFNTIEDLVFNSTEDSVVTINACAGAAKTTSLVEVASRIHKKDSSKIFRYICFGRLLYEEARAAFKTTARTSTVHQLAYEHMIRHGHMRLLRNSNYLSWKDIPKTIKQPFGRTLEAFDLIGNFCNSSITDLDQFCKSENVDYIMSNFIYKLLDAMYQGHMPCTHDIYLKCFHVDLMNGHIELEPVDILAVDEVQDLSPIMLDLITQYPARVKILVGDPYQSIFSFLGCVNAFHYFPDAIKLNLSQTFRCSTHIANAVEEFVHNTFDPEFSFKGFNYVDPEIKTKAYLTRTNASLIAKMIELNQMSIPYRLSTKAKLTQMFEWPLAVMRIKPGHTEKNPKFKPLQDAIDHAVKQNIITKTYTKYKLFLDEFPENQDLKNAVQLVARFNGADIINAYNHAKEHQNSSAPLVLMTAHTSKGTTVDAVELDSDMNESISDIMYSIYEAKSKNTVYKPTAEELTELYLYYVACSRARYSVSNAIYLNLEE